MKKIHNSCFLLLAVWLLSACVNNQRTDHTAVQETNSRFNFQGIDDLYHFLTYSEQRVPLVSAHRGGPVSGYPENAIETFEYIAKKAPVIIECDIALTKDSALVLMHDETLDRTSTGKGKIREHTLADLKKLRLKDNDGQQTAYQIPTLDQALNWGIGRVIYTLDIKRDVPYQIVIDAIRKAKAEPYIVLITYSANQAAVVHNLAPDLMISASIKNREDLIRLNDLDIPDTRLVAFIGTTQADKSLTDFLHEHGILCILGTMGNLDKQAAQRGEQFYTSYIEQGADILSTDRPIEAIKSLAYYIQKRKLSSPFLR